MTIRVLTLLSLCALPLIGCAGEYNGKVKFKEAQYWQRIHASEAAYTRGPKAQQMLNRDIARCVTELRELVRLGTLPASVQEDFTPELKDPDVNRILKTWDEPERNGYLYREYSDYQDFEGCMLHKGWERTMYVPYDIATEGRDAYLESIAHLKPQKHDDKDGTITVNDPDYRTLNE